jgi:hypothetical protein
MRASAGGAYQGEFIHVHRGGKVAAVAADDEYFLVGRYAEPDEESPEAGTPRPLSQQELDLVLGVDIAMFTLPARPRFPRRVPVSSADGCCAILVPVRCRPQAALYPKPSPVSAPRSASRGAVTERDSTQRPPTRAVAVPSPGQPRREPYLRATVPFPSPSGPSRAVDATCGPRVRSGAQRALRSRCAAPRPPQQPNEQSRSARVAPLPSGHGHPLLLRLPAAGPTARARRVPHLVRRAAHRGHRRLKQLIADGVLLALIGFGVQVHDTGETVAAQLRSQGLATCQSPQARPALSATHLAKCRVLDNQAVSQAPCE